MKTAVNSLISELERVKTQRDKLIDALEFYANPETYFAILIVPDPPAGQFMDDFSSVEVDWASETARKPGRHAREAMSAVIKEMVDHEPGHRWVLQAKAEMAAEE